MHMYKPSRSAMFSIYIFVIIFNFALSCACVVGAILLSEYLWYLLLFVLIVTFVGCFIVIPIFFSKTYYSISRRQIICRTGIVIFTKQYMRLDAIRSFTTIITPFSRATGLNFIIINALGSRMVFMLLSKHDTLEIAALLDEAVKQNGKRTDRKEC